MNEQDAARHPQDANHTGWPHTPLVILLLIAALGLFLRIYHLPNEEAWSDEISNLQFSNP